MDSNLRWNGESNHGAFEFLRDILNLFKHADMPDFFFIPCNPQGIFWGWMVLCATVMGLAVGSFLNVCIDRLPLQWLSASEKQNLLSNPTYSPKLKQHIATRRLTLAVPVRSFCFACGQTLGWHDNLPIFSYLWLKGRCRQCQTPFGKRTFWVELANGVGYGGIFGALGLSSMGVLLAFNLSLSLVYLGILVEQGAFSRKFLYGGGFCLACNVGFFGIQTFLK